MLNTAVKAARKAGSLITRASADIDKLTVRSKRQNDFVSEVDHAAEDAIISTLRDAYPTHGFLAEESGERDAKADYVWVIDPLDGTTNFLHGFPVYCVSIALLHKGAAQQAVVYDPNRNELFTASKGAGAYLNDRRIRVTKRDKLQESLILTGFPFRNPEQLDEYLRMFRHMTMSCAGIRRPGAAALDLAWVAAGALLVREAGGLVGDTEGEDGYSESGRVVATNAKIFSAVLQTINRKP